MHIVKKVIKMVSLLTTKITNVHPSSHHGSTANAKRTLHLNKLIVCTTTGRQASEIKRPSLGNCWGSGLRDYSLFLLAQ